MTPHGFGRHIGRMRRSALGLSDLPEITVSTDDDAIVATALAGDAEWLVAGDAGHLLSLGGVGGIAIVSPRAFLAARRL